MSRFRAALLGIATTLLGCGRDQVALVDTAGQSGGRSGAPAMGGSGSANPGTSGGLRGGVGGASVAGAGVTNSGGTGAETNGGSLSGGSAASGGSAGNGGSAGDGGTAASGGSAGNAGGASGSAGNGGSAMNGGAGAGGESESAKCAAGVAGLQVLEAWDPLGYAPYSLHACRLAYINPEGDLLLRDLETGEEQLLDGRENAPRRPSVSAELVAWESTSAGRASVSVFRAGDRVELAGEFDHAGEPRAAADALVFTAWAAESPNSDSDVLLYEPATSGLSTVLGGPGQQRFADVSADYVAATDFSEDPRGYFEETSSVADVVVYERRTGAITLRRRPFKQAFPMLGEDGVLAYLEWGEVHPEPKFSAFSLRLGKAVSPPEQDLLVRAITTDPSYVRPSMQGRVIDFIDASAGPARLYRVDAARPSELLATELNLTTPLGPVATPNATLLGARIGRAVELRLVSRDSASPSP